MRDISQLTGSTYPYIVVGFQESPSLPITFEVHDLSVGGRVLIRGLSVPHLAERAAAAFKAAGPAHLKDAIESVKKEFAEFDILVTQAVDLAHQYPGKKLDGAADLKNVLYRVLARDGNVLSVLRQYLNDEAPELAIEDGSLVKEGPRGDYIILLRDVTSTEAVRASQSVGGSAVSVAYRV